MQLNDSSPTDAALRVGRIRSYYLVGVHEHGLTRGRDETFRVVPGSWSSDLGSTLSHADVTGEFQRVRPHMQGMDRGERGTWIADTTHQVPLGASFIGRLACENSYSTTSVDQLLIFDDGSLVVSGHSTLHDGADLGVAAAVDELRAGREAFEHLAGTALSRIFGFVRDQVTDGSTGPSEYRFTEHRAKPELEFIDFDCSMQGDDGNPVPFEQIRRSPCARELIGFLRLSRPGVWNHYGDDFVREFLEGDLGHRADDLWILVGRRLFRRHPDTRLDVRRYFEDVVLLGASITARLATLRALGGSLSNYSPLADSIGEDIRPADIKRSYSNLVESSSLIARFSSPATLAQRFDHDFFEDIAVALVRSTGLNETEAIAREQLSARVLALDSLSQGQVAIKAMTTNDSIRKLTRWVLALTLVVLVVGAGQAFVTYLSLSEGG